MACGRTVSGKELIAGFCCCVCFATPLTLLQAMNALFTDWLTSFDTDRGSAVAVQAICMGVTLGGGLLAGMLERKVGARVSLVLGAVLASVGLFSGGFASTLPMLILCAGVVTGTGFCLLHLSSLSCAMKRFPERAAFISSAMSVTSGVAHLGTPLLYRYLSELYTWRGSLIVGSGIILNGALFGLLLTSPILSFSETSPKSQSSSKPGDSHPCTKIDGRLNEGEDKALLENETRPRAPLSQQDRSSTQLDSTAPSSRAVEEMGESTVLVSETSTAVDSTARMDHEPESAELNQLTDSPDATGRDAVREESDVAVETGEDAEGEEMTDGEEQARGFIPTTVAGKDASSSKELSVMYLPSNGADGYVNEIAEPLLTQIRCDKESPANDVSDERPNCERNAADLETLGKTDDEHTDRCEVTLPRLSPAPNDFEGDTTEKTASSACQRCPASCGANAAFLTNPIYLCVLLCTVLVLCTIICFVFLVLDFADNKGWTLNDGIFLNFVFMLSTLLARMLLGFVSLSRCSSSVALLIVCGFLGSFGLCLIGQVSSFAVVCFLYACMAASYGGIVGMFPPAVLFAVGPDMCAVAMGLICTVEGVLDAVAGIATGALVDVLGSYRWLTLTYGIIALASTVLLLVVFLCHKPKPPVHSQTVPSS